MAKRVFRARLVMKRYCSPDLQRNWFSAQEKKNVRVCMSDYPFASWNKVTSWVGNAPGSFSLGCYEAPGGRILACGFGSVFPVRALTIAVKQGTDVTLNYQFTPLYDFNESR
ncbi:putative Clp protease protein [Salmonella phage 21]|nr:putative Clp protease protein [Salmonella phage 21]